LGSKVTIIDSVARLLTIEDEDVSDEVAAISRDEGITVLTFTSPEQLYDPNVRLPSWVVAPPPITITRGERDLLIPRSQSSARPPRGLSGWPFSPRLLGHGWIV
jgi:hypothetical protein